MCHRSAMSGIETNDTARFFPDLDELAIKKLFGFLDGCFVVFTFSDLRRLPERGHLCRKCKCDRLARPTPQLQGLQQSPIWVPVLS